MLHPLYEKVSASCCYVTVFMGNDKISEGSGFAYTATGEVLTAAHVVTGRWPIRSEDYKAPGQRIFCKFPRLPLVEYSVFFCAVTVEVPSFSEPIQLDLALLLPKSPFAESVSYLPAVVHPPKLGERVFVAGYSDELVLPFQFEKLLSKTTNGVPAYLEAMEKGYMADMTGPLIKQGHIGNVRRIIAEDTKAGDRVECDFMYIDNSMHSGASGGPVVNANGDAVGVITKRAVTYASQEHYPKLEVPSGCTVGLGLQPLLYIARKTGVA
jgi:Trypsin-like peptidase domain